MRRSCGGTGPSTSIPTGPGATIRPGRWSASTSIITGASSGIGRASAIAVAERGATVFALARNAEALDDLIAEIRAAGGEAHAFTCDVTDSDVGGAHGQGHPRPVRPRRLSGQQRGPVDPAVGDRVHRPAARLRTGDGGQLLRRGAHGAGAAAALARTPVRPRRQRVQRRRAGQQPEVQRLHAEQGRAGRVRRRGGDRDAVRPHHLHQHPHAAGEDADDRAVAAAQPDAADQRRTCRGDGGARPGREAGADRHPAGHARRLRQLLHARSCPAGCCTSSTWAIRIRRRPAERRPPSRRPLPPRRGGPSARHVRSRRCGCCGPFQGRSNEPCDWCPACTGNGVKTARRSPTAPSRCPRCP